MMAGLLVLLQLAAPASDISGDWLDSQGNRIRIAASGGGVSLTSEGPWVFVVDGATTLRAELRLQGSRAGNELRLAQAADRGRVVFNGRVGAGGFIRATMEIPGAAGPVDLALARPPAGEFARKPPRSVHLDLLKQSVEIGRWIPVYVALAAADGEIVAPDREIEVHLEVSGGRPIPPVVRITPGAPRVPAGIAVDGPSARVVASGAGLEPSRASADGCRQGEIQGIGMSIDASRAPADGRHGLPVKVAFLGADESLVTNGLTKPIRWRLEGVGELRHLPGAGGRQQDIAVAEDECVSRSEVLSREAGAAIVTATFRNTETVTLQFIAPLTAASISFALLGAVCGGVVSALRKHRSAMKWRRARWTAWLLSSLVGGVALYLGYHYGVLGVVQAAPGGAGFAFLVGLVGGFLGEVVLERLGGVLLPREAASR
jgi:hypothetical protein